MSTALLHELMKVSCMMFLSSFPENFVVIDLWKLSGFGPRYLQVIFGNFLEILYGWTTIILIDFWKLSGNFIWAMVKDPPSSAPRNPPYALHATK